MINILEVANCDKAATVEVILIIKNFLTLLRIFVPIILIIMSLIQIVKTVSGDADNKKMIHSISKKFIAAGIVFLLPAIINIVMSVAEGIELTNDDCWSKATPEYVQKLKEKEKNEASAEEEKRNNSIKKRFEKWLENAKKVILKTFEKESSNTDKATNDGNSIKFNDWELFYQFDDAWGAKSLCNGNGNIAGAGCGYTSFAMIANHFSSSRLTPPTVVKQICSITGEDGSAIEDVNLVHKGLLQHYNLQSEVLFHRGRYNKGFVTKEVEAALKKNHPVILLIPDHYVVLAKMVGNKVLLLNPGMGGTDGGNGQSGWYTIDELYSATYNYKNRCTSKNTCGWIYAISYWK